MKTRCMASVAGLALASMAAGETITVCIDGSCDFDEIQAAIDYASDGDEVVVTAGFYTSDNPGHVVDMKGKAITLRSLGGSEVTFIDGEGLRRGIACYNGETKSTVIEGFTIRNGFGVGYNYNGSFGIDWWENCGGGMINTLNSSPTLVNCTFVRNSTNGTYGYGGGISNTWESNPTLMSCTFIGNSANGTYGRGGAIYNVWESNPTLMSCTFIGNSASYRGGAVYNSVASSTLEDCSIYGNSSNVGGGIYNTSSSGPTLTNTLLCGNTNGQLTGEWIDGGGNCLSLLCQDPNGDGHPDCDGSRSDEYLSVPDEYATIELAIDAAAEGAVIDIAAGNYAPVVTLDTLGKAITLRGAINDEGVPVTIIDGQDAIRVLQCSSGEDADTVLENLIISGGNAVRGAGIYTYQSSPSLTNCIFMGNVATDYGGGMLNVGDGSPTLKNTVFCGNAPDQVYGNWIDDDGNCLAFSCIDDDGDGVPDECGGVGGDMLHVPSGEYPTIASAIVAAKYGDIIEIAAGSYEPVGALNTQGKRITLRGAIDGQGDPITIIDGQGSIRILECTSGEGDDTIFKNLIITNADFDNGGGMYNYQSSPTLTNCVFSDNASNAGGGIYNYSYSSPTLTDCLFDGNRACCNQGGGMWNRSNSNPTLENCTFKDNFECGIANVRSSPSLNNCTFANNIATGSTNTCYSGHGGGMYNDDSSPSVTNCTFTGNAAIYYGGGIANRNNSSPILLCCSFFGNSAAYGGGIANRDYSSPALVDCNFRNNLAQEYAGCTLHSGGGMYSEMASSPVLAATVICENTPDQIFGPWTDNGGNTISDECPIDWGVCSTPQDCGADLNNDGMVNGADLIVVLGDWGTTTRSSDLNGDGFVDGADLNILLGSWGPCP